MKNYYIFKKKLRQGAVMDYVEFEDDWAIRQVRYCDGEWKYADASDPDNIDNSFVCDQPLSEMDIKDENLIDVSKFNWAWDQAQQRVAA
jgi:hypothetical protein